MKNLSDYIEYNHETGILTWIKKPSSKVYVGDVAGCEERSGYLSFGFCGKKIKSHRAAWEIYYGDAPSGQIDHINGNRSDNRICNLRVSDNRSNCRNKRKYSNNTTGIMGVTRKESIGKWQAAIKVNYKSIYLGVYECFFDACCARKSAESRFGFDSSHGDESKFKYKDTEIYRRNANSHPR